MDRVGAVTRLLAALVAPVVGVLAFVAWGPDLSAADRLGSIADIGQRATLPEAASAQGPVILRDPAAPPTAASRGESRASVRRVPRADSSALSVSIDALTPTVVPLRGVVVVRGRVTNRSDETWSDVNVIPCTSATPMTTEAELRAAVESDPELQVCGRIAPFDAVGDLAPGQTRSYRVRIPRADLGIPGVAGVYWFNMQALGTNTDGRDGVSDGRARSFLPVVAARPTPVATSLVVPIRRATLREADGRLEDVEGWADEVARGGRLRGVLDFVEGAGGQPVALLVDPAVLDAVEQLAAGNPPRDLGPLTTEEPEADGDGTGPALDDRVSEDTRSAAREWLADAVRLAGRHPVLGLPYGDLDLTAAARTDRGLASLAFTQSARAFEQRKITAAPAVVPPSGVLDEFALEALDEVRPQVLLSEEALPEELRADGALPDTVMHDGAAVGVYESSVAAGGPGPNNPLAPVALRQRLLAEAALRSRAGDARPLVVTLPADFEPGSRAGGFFPGLDHPVVRLDDDVIGSGIGAPEVEDLAYPQRQVDRELPATGIAAARALVRDGTVLDRLLPETDGVAGQVTRQALGTASYLVRDDQYAAQASAQSAARWIRARLARVTITAPSFVILSSDSGQFAVSVSNGLDQPIRLRIRAYSRADLEIRAQELIELEAGAQQTVSLSARARNVGVHPVTLIATDEELAPLGASEEISVRTNEVGLIIWVIMGTGVGILFLAIAVRLTRRIRRARAS